MTKNITVRYWVSHTWPYSIDDKPDDPEAKIYTIAIDEREIFIRNGKKYYSLQSGHGQSTDLLIEGSLMGQNEGIEMTDIICMCGHHINGHGDNGCIHCKCSESRKILELSNENDALRKQNEDILSELIRIEFYGANGYCTVCHQPLEGRGCPYCGWEDKNPPQYGYEFVHRTPMKHSRNWKNDWDKRKEGIEMITCECGHAIDIHDLTGCNFPRPYAPNDCMCELSPEAIEARYWAKRYYNRFNRMEYYANMLNDEVIKLREKLDAWEIVLTDSQTERDMLNVYADELKASLDIAVKGLEWYAISPMITGDAVALATLAKIKKLEE